MTVNINKAYSLTKSFRMKKKFFCLLKQFYEIVSNLCKDNQYIVQSKMKVHEKVSC